LNPVVDGLFYWAVRHQGEPAALREIPKDRSSRSDRAHLDVRGHQGAESVVTIMLTATVDETEFTLGRSGVPDDETGHRHKEAWTAADPTRPCPPEAVTRDLLHG
jgi:hypothetical protein